VDLQRLCVNTIKGLAMDAVEAANSGHPGMPMGMANAATVLWQRFLKHDPKDPTWPDRDRFVLSAGHGSMLLYSLLHLSGYDLPLDELKRFRQWGSKTPGHPEHGLTVGVETTTGPLGQGFGNAVGMAIAERFLRESFGSELCDHWIYGICSDGDLMEGVSQEAASLAGHLGLGRLIFLYDDNHISIDGSTDLAFTEDRAMRFRADGWHVQQIDGHDAEAVFNALDAARGETSRPSIIMCRTVIGEGSRLQGSEKTHGAALGAEEVRWTKQNLGLDPDVNFAIPPEVVRAFRSHEGEDHRRAWGKRLGEQPRRAEFESWLARDTRALVEKVQWPAFKAGDKLATRKASQACLKAIIAEAPWLIGGSADLAGSNGTETGKPLFTAAKFTGAQTLAFGVREHGMGAIANGMTLHGGVLPYVATFLIFHDYQRPSVRLACLMEQQVVYVYTHDSIFLGEDGPTHQPIETLLALRAIPHMHVVRPGDAAETAEAWKLALLRRHGPTAIILTRQNLPVFDRVTLAPAAGTARGAYVLQDVKDPQLVLIGTGSEVSLALDAAKLLAEQGVRARVVSMPCREIFRDQDAGYRAEVLPKGIPRVSIEAATVIGWEAIVGEGGLSIGIDRFGASAPDKVLAEKLGFTPKTVATRAAALLAPSRPA
jgi:transketolase